MKILAWEQPYPHPTLPGQTPGNVIVSMTHAEAISLYGEVKKLGSEVSPIATYHQIQKLRANLQHFRKSAEAIQGQLTVMCMAMDGLDPEGMTDDA